MGDAHAMDQTTWQPDLHRVSTVVYAERGDQILLLKRAMGFLTGQWFIPGGALDAGESPAEGARRELREEAGLDIEGDPRLAGLIQAIRDDLDKYLAMRSKA